MLRSKLASMIILGIIIMSFAPTALAQADYGNRAEAVPKVPVKLPQNTSINVKLSSTWTYVNITTYAKSESNLTGFLNLEKSGNCTYNLAVKVNGYEDSLNSTYTDLGFSGRTFGTKKGEVFYIHSEDSGHILLKMINDTSKLMLRSWISEIRDLTLNTTSESVFEHSKLTSNATSLVIVQGTRGGLTLNITKLSLDYWSRSWKEGETLRSSSIADLNMTVTLVLNNMPIPVGDIKVKWKSNSTTTKGSTTTDFDLLMKFSDPYTATLVYNILKNVISNMKISNVTVTQPSPTEVEVKGHLVGKISKKIKGIEKIARPPTPLVALMNSTVSGFKLEYSGGMAIDSGNVSVRVGGKANLECNKTLGYGLEYLKLSIAHPQKSEYVVVNLQLNVTHPEPITSFLVSKDLMSKLVSTIKEKKAKVTVTLESASNDIRFIIKNSKLSKVVFTSENLTKASALHLIYKGNEIAGSGNLIRFFTSSKRFVTEVPLTARKLEFVGPKEVYLVLPSSVKVTDNLSITITNNIASNASLVILSGSKVNKTLKVYTLAKEEATDLLPKDLKAEVIGPGLRVSGASGSAVIKLPLEQTKGTPALLVVEKNGSYKVIKEVKTVNGYLIAKVKGFSSFIPISIKSMTTTTSTTQSSVTTTTYTTTTVATTTTTTQVTTTTTQTTTTRTETYTTTTYITHTTKTKTTTVATTTTGKTTTTGTTHTTATPTATATLTTTKSTSPTTTTTSAKKASNRTIVAAIIVILIVVMIGVALILRK